MFRAGECTASFFEVPLASFDGVPLPPLHFLNIAPALFISLLVLAGLFGLLERSP
jgi:hypothetical protein